MGVLGVWGLFGGGGNVAGAVDAPGCISVGCTGCGAGAEGVGPAGGLAGAEPCCALSGIKDIITGPSRTKGRAGGTDSGLLAFAGKERSSNVTSRDRTIVRVSGFQNLYPLEPVSYPINVIGIDLGSSF